MLLRLSQHFLFLREEYEGDPFFRGGAADAAGGVHTDAPLPPAAEQAVQALVSVVTVDVLSLVAGLACVQRVSNGCPTCTTCAAGRLSRVSNVCLTCVERVRARGGSVPPARPGASPVCPTCV